MKLCLKERRCPRGNGVAASYWGYTHHGLHRNTGEVTARERVRSPRAYFLPSRLSKLVKRGYARYNIVTASDKVNGLTRPWET